MKRIAIVLALLVAAGMGCQTGTVEPAGNRDALLGWYHLPNRHYRTREILPGPGTLIPVFKRDGIYYSICRGVEVRLTECPKGLEWGSLPSSMKGTTIGLEEGTQEPYIIIEDANAQYEADLSTSGEKQFMTRSGMPPGLLDPTARAPRTHEDFLGCYLPVWFPAYRWVVRKNGGKFSLEGQLAGEDGWKTDDGETVEIVPLAGQPGFEWGSKKENRLVYNERLNRFEYASPDGHVVMPLARVWPSLPPGTGSGSPPRAIGIPSWH